MPMVGALRAPGWKADAVFYDDAEFDALLERIPQQYFASIARGLSPTPRAAAGSGIGTFRPRQRSTSPDGTFNPARCGRSSG